jgi:peptidoglycan/LPS O-acetylase OafA/YrhL
LARPALSLRNSRGGALDALRFLAAAFIVVFRLGDAAPVPLRSIQDVFGRGYLATDFFLLLSGFVLATTVYGERVLDGRVSPAQFLARRAARSYPAHLITLTALVVVVLAAAALGHGVSHAERFPWAAGPAHLLMLHGWGFAPDTWNAPTWTLSALFVCYAGFPWIWPLFAELKRPSSCVATGLAILVGADLSARLLAGHPLFELPFQWGLFRAIPLFLTGLSLARLVQTATLQARAGAIALGGAAALAFNLGAAGPDIVSVLAICTVIVGCGAMEPGRRWPGAEWGAKVSFSLFFTHTVSAAFYNDAMRPLLLRLGDGMAWQWAIWWTGLAFVLAVAAGFQRYVDEPLQRRLRVALFRGSPARRPALAPSA